MKSRTLVFTSALLATCATAWGQVPDLLTSFDAGSAALGSGGVLHATGGGTISAYYNPAGLAYATRKEISLVGRNLPTSQTSASGNSDNRLLDTKGEAGGKGLTHAGIAIPLKNNKGVVALTYTLGGYVDDTQTSSSLQFGGLTASDYVLTTKARTDVFTLAYARADASQTFSWGVGLNYVRQRIAYTENGVPGQTSLTDVSETGHGFGATIGIQGVPKSMPNFSWGLSYRTPVALSGNPITESLYKKIPARALGGIALRQDGIHGQDYLVYGVQGEYYFKGDASSMFDRGNQLVTSLGLEYNLVRNGGRFPIRLGYVLNPQSGEGYGSGNRVYYGKRNSFNYGLGYRPDNGRYDVDLGFARTSDGIRDFSFGLTYRFDH